MKKSNLTALADHWGHRLTTVLKEQKLSLRKAAAIAGVSPSTADSWSAGRSPSDLKAVKRLCDHLGISFTWLLTGEDDVKAGIELEQIFENPSIVFDGYLKVKIERMIPRTKGK